MITKGRRQSKNIDDTRGKRANGWPMKTLGQQVRQDISERQFEKDHPVSKKVGNAMENAAYQDSRRLANQHRTRLGGVKAEQSRLQQANNSVLTDIANAIRKKMKAKNRGMN